jgi:hypothetical protein
LNIGFGAADVAGTLVNEKDKIRREINDFLPEKSNLLIYKSFHFDTCLGRFGWLELVGRTVGRAR